jgi:hypothetical protein
LVGQADGRGEFVVRVRRSDIDSAILLAVYGNQQVARIPDALFQNEQPGIVGHRVDIGNGRLGVGDAATEVKPRIPAGVSEFRRRRAADTVPVFNEDLPKARPYTGLHACRCRELAAPSQGGVGNARTSPVVREYTIAVATSQKPFVKLTVDILLVIAFGAQLAGSALIAVLSSIARTTYKY